MRSLMLAVRGIWWRRWSSVAIFLVGVICAAVAAVATTFGFDAREAVVQATVRHAAPDAGGTGTTVTLQLDGSVSVAQFERQTEQAFAALRGNGFVGAPIDSESGDTNVLSGQPQRITATAPLLYRGGSCEQVTIRAGKCVADSSPRGVLVTRGAARARGWRVGSPIVVGNLLKHRTLHVRGIYDPVAPSGSYWFGRSTQYFGSNGHSGAPAEDRTEAVIVPRSYWERVAPPTAADNVSAALDFPLVTDRVRISTLGQLRSLYAAANYSTLTALLKGTQNGSVDSELLTILDRARASVRSVVAPVLAVGAQLIILTWLVLYVVLVRSADERTGEVVLGKLRGLSGRETVLHAVLEPTLLIVAAVPVGVVVCAVATDAIGPSILGSHTELVLPTAAWAAAGVAGLGGLVAVVLTSANMLNRSVVDQWRRAERRPRGGSWVVVGVVAALAVAGFVELLQVPAPLGGAADVLPSCAPALLALAFAVLGMRLVPVLARTGLRRTRRSSHVAAFIALRQLARRSADARVFVLLTVSVTLVVFGSASRSVFTANGRARAMVELGADRVVDVGSPRGVDPSAVVGRLDPAGRWASAVYAGTASVSAATRATGSSSRLLVVDPTTFARVAFWRPDFGSSTHLADQLEPLRSAPPTAVDVTMTSLRIDASVHVESVLPVELHVGLTDAAGRAIDVMLGRLTPETPGSTPRAVHLTAAVPGCASACRFRRFSIEVSVFDHTLPKVTLGITAVDAVSAAGSQPLLTALRAMTWTSPDTGADGAAVVTAATSSGSLSFAFAPAFTPINVDTGYEIVGNLPPRVPALVTAGQLPPSAPDQVTADVGQAPAITLSPTRVAVLPQAGVAGVLISRAWLPAARPDGYDQYQPNQVWLGPSAPADFPARLAGAGLIVRGVHTSVGRARETAALGPAYVKDMLVFGAGTAGVLAVVGCATSLLVASRRRLYELAALRALGVRPGRVLATLILEQGAVTAAASTLGLGAGLIGARAALTRLPEFADQASFPPLAFDLPVLLCVGLASAVAASVVLSVALGGLDLVRRASPSRLREAAA